MGDRAVCQEPGLFPIWLNFVTRGGGIRGRDQGADMRSHRYQAGSAIRLFARRENPKERKRHWTCRLSPPQGHSTNAWFSGQVLSFPTATWLLLLSSHCPGNTARPWDMGVLTSTLQGWRSYGPPSLEQHSKDMKHTGTGIIDTDLKAHSPTYYTSQFAH